MVKSNALAVMGEQKQSHHGEGCREHSVEVQVVLESLLHLAWPNHFSNVEIKMSVIVTAHVFLMLSSEKSKDWWALLMSREKENPTELVVTNQKPRKRPVFPPWAPAMGEGLPRCSFNKATCCCHSMQPQGTQRW